MFDFEELEQWDEALSALDTDDGDTSDQAEPSDDET